MKNVAIINAYNGGSTGNIAINLYNALESRGFNPYLCYAAEFYGKKSNLCNEIKICSKLYRKIQRVLGRITGLQGSFSYVATKKLIHKFKNIKIDTIYLVNIHCDTVNERLLFKYSNDFKAKIIYVMIDEYPMTGRCCYPEKCEQYKTGCLDCKNLSLYPPAILNTTKFGVFRKQKSYNLAFSLAFSAPMSVIERAKESFLLKDRKLVCINEGINTNIFCVKKDLGLRNKLHIPEDKIFILFVAPSGDLRKGCIDYIKCVKRFENNPGYYFLHIGYTSNYELPSNYNYLGYITDQTLLADYMSCADLFVFPSVADSSPSACLNAIACGTPILCYDLPGMTCMGESPIINAVKEHNIDEMISFIQHTTRKTDELSQVCRKHALDYFDEKDMAGRLISLALN